MSVLSEREIKKLRDEIEKQIGVIKRTGKLIYGYNNTIRAIQNGRAKVVIVATEAPEEFRMMVRYLCALTQTPIVEFPGTSTQLGVACRRPHLVSMVAVIDEGASNILNLAKVLSL